MDVKQAVETAKRYVGELFDQEGIKNLGLEEIELDHSGGEWRVTVGFSRPWTTQPAHGLLLWDNRLVRDALTRSCASWTTREPSPQ